MMHSFTRTQLLPISLEEAWNYFSRPENLNEITPPDFSFRITSQVPEKIYEGLIITYVVSPIANVRMNWVTEITHIQDRVYFIDEQRFGPYKFWHHEHHFEKVNGGVKMTDIVLYDLGKGIAGELAHKWFVKRRLEEIFNFRHQTLSKKFV